ncbi:hypothetical protein SLS55_000539 [Diplodia seriata]|uniref:Zn(2)-C6 fungal-type domain-containing protein n=1 Tax=Diplodia seriata TaxID=420778 RepID=A0ABR3CVL5_9PEZI
MKASVPPQRMRSSSIPSSCPSTQTATFLAAFIVDDAAQRWDKAIGFSSQCEIIVDIESESFVVQHKDHGWRIVFPIASQVKRLVPCQSCRLNRSSSAGVLCDDSSPCRTCQQQGSPCIARNVNLPGVRAINGEAEMEAAAEEASLIEPYYESFAFVAWATSAGEPNAYEGYLPMLPDPEPPVHEGEMLSSSSRMPPSTPVAAPLTPRNMRPVPDSELRRSNRIQGLKDRVDESPAPRGRSGPLNADQCLARMRKLAAAGYVNSNTASTYSLEPQHPPSTVDLGGLELTMAEISVFLLNLVHRPEGAMRMINNGWTTYHFCTYHNYSRGLKGETRIRGDRSEGAVRTTITRSVQKTMRAIADDKRWTQADHIAAPSADLSTADWPHLVEDPPSHSLRDMGSQIARWPPEKHSLNLTRAVRFAVEHPQIPDDQLRFPTHVRAIVECLPEGFRSRVSEASGPDDNLDQTILKEWEAFLEAQGM